ncbi:chromate transporter [Pseudothermotoga sp. U03pept]|uniref:chromate transporter n=1 Tax=Pseudothermotoga sp. U03pept TaxID=3447012 RepID=UPI003F04DC15
MINAKLLRKVFFTFLKISALTLGGGYAMIPVMQWEAKKLNWLTEDEFYKNLSIAQSIPGPIAFNTAIIIGKQVAGILGAFLAGLAIVIPPFLAIVAVASVIKSFSASVYVQGFLNGCYAAVIGLVFNVFYGMLKRQKWDLFRILVVLTGVILLILNSSLLIFVFLGVIGVLYLKGAK